MKWLNLIVALLFVTNVYSNHYYPFVKENVEWQVVYSTYPYNFQLSRTTVNQIYTLFGDTVINQLTYKKLCLKSELNYQPIYQYMGAVRESDKKVYYVGNGYFTTFNPSAANAAKVKSMYDCFSSEKSGDQEILLYDFNAKTGDYVEWGYTYRQIVYEDSVLVGNAYRKCLHLSDHDKVVEGIGSVVNGMLSFVTPVPTCSDYYFNWTFDSFLTNGIIMYKSEKSRQSNGYQSVYSHRKAYFSTDDQKIVTLKVDSCSFFNDTIMYPSRSVQLIENNCYVPDGGSCIGKRIEFNNQWNYFFNEENDTIRIKTDAALNETWTLFHRPDFTVLATVSRWDTAKVAEIIDSVKTITLHCFDRTMKPLESKFENETIAVSKKFGLTKALNFNLFPDLNMISETSVTQKIELIGLTNPSTGAYNLKWFEVFDFNVGDEFHYVESSNYLMTGGSANEKKIIVRITKRENFNDSIRYTEDIQSVNNYKQNVQSDLKTTYEHYQYSEVIKKNPEFETEPGIPVFDMDSAGFRVYNQFNASGNADLYRKNNNCWEKVVLIDDACNKMSFSNGRGLTFSSGGCWEWKNFYQVQQVYYKKGTTVWGSPIVINTTEPITQSFFNVYPNPANDDLFIQLNGIRDCYIEVFDSQGKLIIYKELQSFNNQLKLRQQNKGIYFFRILKNNQPLHSGKFIKN